MSLKDSLFLPASRVGERLLFLWVGRWSMLLRWCRSGPPATSSKLLLRAAAMATAAVAAGFDGQAATTAGAPAAAAAGSEKLKTSLLDF